jgi:hypothetical protein
MPFVILLSVTQKWELFRCPLHVACGGTWKNKAKVWTSLIQMKKLKAFLGTDLRVLMSYLQLVLNSGIKSNEY